MLLLGETVATSLVLDRLIYSPCVMRLMIIVFFLCSSFSTRI